VLVVIRASVNSKGSPDVATVQRALSDSSLTIHLRRAVTYKSWPPCTSETASSNPMEHLMRSRIPALIVIISGVVFFVAGVATYAVVSSTLSSENITVSKDATMFADQHVDQPWEAYAEAQVINEHANKLAGGKTYAELPQTDPNRATVMNASFLQASLFTSVVAFGVAAMAAVLGVLLVIIGMAIRPLNPAAASTSQPTAASTT
jgi:hypothetical protein